MNKLSRKKISCCIALLSALIPSVHAQKTKPEYSWSNLPKVTSPVFKRDTFNIVKYGAKPDGITINSRFINQAIDMCSKTGGGVVLVPQGMWLTGPIVLKSNVNLHISRAAVLQFTGDKSQYPLVEGNFEGHRAIRNQAPITGEELTNVAITGEGIIDGHGQTWRAMGKDRVTEAQWKTMIGSGVLSDDSLMWYPSESYKKGSQIKDAGIIVPGKTLKDYQEIKDFFRPNLLVLVNCDKVLLEGTTFENSPAWCLHTLQCENLTFRGIHVRNEENAQNGDGMDIESCSYVLVENCTLDCGDDGICIKSGRDEEGRRRGKPTQYVVVRNNVVYKAHGGFVIGSETSGGVHDIFVSDCSFIGTDNGLRFKTVRGRGGIVERIFIRNINMRAIVSDAILFDMYYFTKAIPLEQTGGKGDAKPVDAGTPKFRNFYITNITCDGADRAMLIRGLPEMSIKDIHLDHLFMKTRTGVQVTDAEQVSIKNLRLTCKDNNALIQVENSRGILIDTISTSQAPALWLTINGVLNKDITFSNVSPVSAGPVAEYHFGATPAALTVIK